MPAGGCYVERGSISPVTPLHELMTLLEDLEQGRWDEDAVIVVLDFSRLPHFTTPLAREMQKLEEVKEFEREKEEQDAEWKARRGKRTPRRGQRCIFRNDADFLTYYTSNTSIAAARKAARKDKEGVNNKTFRDREKRLELRYEGEVARWNAEKVKAKPYLRNRDEQDSGGGRGEASDVGDDPREAVGTEDEGSRVMEGEGEEGEAGRRSTKRERGDIEEESGRKRPRRSVAPVNEDKEEDGEEDDGEDKE
jgi:hypothetical protein